MKQYYHDGNKILDCFIHRRNQRILTFYVIQRLSIWFILIF